MPVAQLAGAMNKRGDAMLELAMAQANWREKQEEYRKLIASFRATAAKLTQDAVSAQDAKESAQATFEKILGAIGGIAAGISVGAGAL